MQLLVVIASTRPGRVGDRVGRWFVTQAREHGGFDVQVADLAEFALPLLDEPHHPRLGRYEHEHTKRWSAVVSAADAVVFVMPEYNYGYSAPLKNAIDYLHTEWAYKPIGFVSYGGMSGGIRAVQMIKQVVTALRMFPVSDAVPIPMVATMIDEDGLHPTEIVTASAKAMLDELVTVTAATSALRIAG